MAFGKDPNVRQAAGGSFRQQAGQHNAHKEENRSSTRGAAPYFVGQFKPPTTDAAAIRILEGKYEVQEAVAIGKDDKGHTRWQVNTNILPFFPWVEHFDGRPPKRSCVCS